MRIGDIAENLIKVQSSALHSRKVPWEGKLGSAALKVGRGSQAELPNVGRGKLCSMMG